MCVPEFRCASPKLGLPHNVGVTVVPQDPDALGPESVGPEFVAKAFESLFQIFEGEQAVNQNAFGRSEGIGMISRLSQVPDFPSEFNSTGHGRVR